MKDYIVRAMAANNQVRAFAATTREMVETARQRHNTSPVATAALGRLLTGGAMMGSMMKNEKDVLTIQINCYCLTFCFRIKPLSRDISPNTINKCLNNNISFGSTN